MIFLLLSAIVSMGITAGENDLLWDYTNGAPKSSPDAAQNNASVGLFFNNKVEDAAGTNNGLKGIKLNSSGYCYFTKAAVKGKLRLSFGPRSGQTAASLEVFTWSGDTPNAETSIARTSEYNEYSSEIIDLSAEQNNIYIKRLKNTETVLQKIEFREGDEWGVEECEVIFKDQDGKEIGRLQLNEGDALPEIPYGVEDLPVFPDAMAFRGWFYTSGKKAFAGDIIEGNTTIQAKVTAIEYATTGSVQTYDFTSPIFYPEDRDLIQVKGGAYVNASKGWEFGEEGSIILTTGSAKTVVVLKKNGTEEELRYESMRSVGLEVANSTIQSIIVYNVQDYMEKDENTGYFVVPAGDAASLLMALAEANKTGNARIFLPNGVYDLGEKVLTAITANGISLIGQSTEGVIIKNAPDYKTESINKTATLLISKNVKNTYLQDLTLQNALDYYKNDNGRAVALWDQGTQTICKNVRLLSYQDTYYSNLQGAVKYFEDCEIHGTVDFICGDGSVYFKNNLLYCEKRNKSNSGTDALTANNGVSSDRGYVFADCTVKSECPSVSLGRAWNNTPTTTYINLLADYSAGAFSFISTRWTPDLMNANAWPRFGEFNTHLADGTVLTPESNVVTFVDGSSGNVKQDIETILKADEAAVFTMEYTLGDWAETAKAEAQQAIAEQLAEDLEPDAVYLAETEGEFVMLLKGSEFFDKLALYNGVVYTLRKANSRGGFGKRAGEEPSEGVSNIQSENIQSTKMIRDGQVFIQRNGMTYDVLGKVTNF